MNKLIAFWKQGDGDSFWRTRVVIGSTLFLFMVSQIISGVARAADPPACWPSKSDFLATKQRVAVTALPKGFRDKWIVNYTCQTATGYRNVAIVYKDADVTQWGPSFLAGTLTTDAMNASYKATADNIIEDNLRAAMQKISVQYRATASVTKNGDALTRPVYFENPDGTLTQLPSTMFRVAVGDPCLIAGRHGSTNYYSVYGRPNVATPFDGDKFGTGIVAQCTPYFPLVPVGG